MGDGGDGGAGIGGGIPGEWVGVEDCQDLFVGMGRGAEGSGHSKGNYDTCSDGAIHEHGHGHGHDFARLEFNSIQFNGSCTVCYLCIC